MRFSKPRVADEDGARDLPFECAVMKLQVVPLDEFGRRVVFEIEFVRTLDPDELRVLGASLDSGRMAFGQFRPDPFLDYLGEPLLLAWLQGWPVLGKLIAPVFKFQLTE